MRTGTTSADSAGPNSAGFGRDAWDTGGGAQTHSTAFIERAAAEKRTEVPASELALGLNCGGSDSFSGITANPALGFCCDLIVDQGGTVVLAETTEIFGAEHLLCAALGMRRLPENSLRCVEKYKAYFANLAGTSMTTLHQEIKKAGCRTFSKNRWERLPKQAPVRSRMSWNIPSALESRASCL